MLGFRFLGIVSVAACRVQGFRNNWHGRVYGLMSSVSVVGFRVPGIDPGTRTRNRHGLYVGTDYGLISEASPRTESASYLKPSISEGLGFRVELGFRV